MDTLLGHIGADVERWLSNDEITEHVAGDLQHYLRRVSDEFDKALLVACAR